jgi:hypothetical protein
VTFSKALETAKSFASKYAPWISLGVGVIASLLSKHEIDFAPKAVALLMLAWTLPAVLTRVLPGLPEGAKEPGWRRVARTTGAPFVIVALYKNVLFFLVPIWFSSAHFPSLNMGMPLLLAAMALLTCFASQYHDHVLARPVRRVLWSSLVLFAVLVPALAVLAYTSPRVTLFLSALIATSVATASLKNGENILSQRAILGILSGAVPVALLAVLAAPFLPPVPSVCHDKGTGTAIANKNLVGKAYHFPNGTKRVYAWFAVAMPAHYRQQVSYQWYHNKKRIGNPIVSTIEGGRSTGFRTTSYKTNPSPGVWRADLYTDSSQLIGRVEFVIDP